MNATTYTGNGTSAGSTQTIINGASGASFQPDLVWLKSRSDVQNHNLTDSVRGISGTGSPILFSDTTSAETTYTGYGVSALNSNGFTLIGNGGLTNNNGFTYVGWQWKAGGTAVSNTSGSITSSVSTNTTSGFSIVTYTGNGTAGATVGHGLGVTPSMIIVKKRSAADSWQVYNANLTSAAYRLVLSATSAQDSQPTMWNSTAPTSSVFSIGTDSGVNTSSGTYVAYCWAPIAGYSAFGSYTGNGSADGPFVYLGFRPRYVLIKCSSNGGLSWEIYDTSRNPYNAVNTVLLAENSSGEFTGGDIDYLSNGFKFRTTRGSLNTSGYTYIYAAFAENPFKYANAR
jgi:hypothetical protein